jgi:predicted  nucleic acid-binding Zn-ribbon protein
MEELAGLRDRLKKAKSATVKAKIQTAMDALNVTAKNIKTALDTAKKAFNQAAKQKMKIENERKAKEEEQKKQRDFSDAKNKVEKYAKNI